MLARAALGLLTALLIASPAAAKPAAPTLAAPADKAQVEALGSFTWGSVKGAERYDFELSADRNFGSVQSGARRGGAIKTKNTAATIQDPLADGTYFWRVRAIDAKQKAGAWSAVREITKRWTTPPGLTAPADGSSITWPATPLLLRWTSVPGARRYLVHIATDPTFATPVLGTVADPVETQGTVYALQGTLPNGRYHWAITPVDTEGHRGARSRVGSFTWSWPTQTRPAVADVNPSVEVFDPLLSWDPVPGAARYEVEVNPSEDFAPGSKVCCSDPTTGTSLSPTKLLENNRYFWKVRAIDADGNSGVWNLGPAFDKTFDAVVPSVKNLRLRDDVGGASVVSWDPVPGASGYELQLGLWQLDNCEWPDPQDPKRVWLTQSTAWTPILNEPGIPDIGPKSWPGLARASMGGGGTFCVRVLAYNHGGEKDVRIDSEWSYLGGANTAGLTHTASSGCADTVPPVLPASAYRAPTGGVVARRLPLFTWDAQSGARGYYVVVARDKSFSNVVDVAFTHTNAYSPDGLRRDPRERFSDETTAYYWMAIPARCANGTGLSADDAAGNHPQAFQKQSVPPALLAPAPDAEITTQPTFRWTMAEGARRYVLQVATDPSFGEPIDTVTTASTAYTSSSTYPVDTVLYWRVRAQDEGGTGLTWSPVGTFRRRLPVPAPDAGNPTGGEAIPAFNWTPVEGAVSYALHVDQADGTTKDFVLRSPIFTPVLFYGVGVWRWRVAANFPTATARTVSSAYTSGSDFTRRIGAPGKPRDLRTKDRILLAWDPDASTQRYRVEIAATNAFDKIIESSTTGTTDFAPLLTARSYDEGGTLHWRVASIDEGNNVGAWATATLRLPSLLSVKVDGTPRKGAKGKLKVTVLTAKGRAVKAAKVAVSGLGVKRSVKTDKKGRAVLSVKPRKKGELVVRVTAADAKPYAGRVRVSR